MDLEDLDTADGIHFGAIVLDGQAITAGLVDMEDLAGLDMIHSGLVHLDTTLSGVADSEVLEALDMTHSGADSEALVVMVDLEDLAVGVDGTLTTQVTGILTDQFTMVVV